MKIGIYKITNLVNRKVYIGQSLNLKKRASTHFNNLEKGNHTNKHLQSSYNKYGKDNFKFEILENLEIEVLLNEREKYWIDYFGGLNKERVYNILYPFEYLDDFDRREKISNVNSGVNNPNYGNKWSDEMKKKSSDLRIGKTWEELYGENKAKEMKFKSSNSKIGEKNSMFGKKHSKETIKKISISNSGKGDRQRGEKNPMFGKISKKRKKILQIDVKGNIVKEYDFLSQVKEDGFSQGNVCSAANGKLEFYKGFKWRYKE